MKLLLTSIFFAIAISVTAQRADSTQAQIDLAASLEYIQENLHASHQQFKKGLKVAAAGAALFSVALVAMKPHSDFQLVAGFHGAAISVIGITLMIDSHKYIGRAGRMKVKTESPMISGRSFLKRNR